MCQCQSSRETIDVKIRAFGIQNLHIGVVLTVYRDIVLPRVLSRIHLLP